jgi:amino acid transporter
LNKSKWIPNVGTPIKFVIFLVLGGFGINYGIENGFANDVNVLNGFSDLAEGLAFIPVIVYGCLGVELICSESKRIKNPSGNVPKAMIIAGLLTGGLYIFATLGVLAAVPLEDIEITEILATTLSELFGGSVIGHAFALIIGGMTLFTFFSTIVAWTIGGNRAVAEAGQEKEMPAVFGITNKRTDAPKGAAIMTGMVSTVTLLLYGCMANSAEELFWTLFSFSAIIFLMPYIAMHCAFLKLRTINTTVNRPFKVPGGQNIGTLFALICISTLALAILLFFWVPGEPLDMTLLAQVGSGVLFTLVFGELLIRRGEAYKN